MYKWIFTLIFSTLLLSGHAFALGLGEIQVNSTLNQQLDARIDLISATPEDADVMIVKLASREEFIKANLDRPQQLSSLRFKALVEGGRVYIKVMSPKPVIEPSLNFLLEVDWPQGHLVRQYTILLDPPASMRKKAKQKAEPAPNRPAIDG